MENETLEQRAARLLAENSNYGSIPSKSLSEEPLKTRIEYSLPVYIPAESLTKENFWNDLQSNYPKGMKVFCNWIDNYKKAVNWDALFPKIWMYRKTPEYHDLPFAMQIGIFTAFIYWLANSNVPGYHITPIEILPLDASDRTWAGAITDCIKHLNVELS